MDNFEEFLNTTIANVLSPERCVSLLIIRKLRQQGFILKDGRFPELVDYFAQQVHDRFSQAEQSGLLNLNIDTDFFVGEDLTFSQNEIFRLEFTDEELNDFEKVVENIQMSTAFELIVEIWPQTLLSAWKENASTVLRRERRIASQLDRSLYEVWGKALDLLEMLSSVCLDVGDRFNEKYRGNSEATYDIVLDVLTRLHARGCQISREIHVLLSNGLADGAHARWRTLHEVAVVAAIIADHGEEIARRYLDHVHINNYKTKDAYQQRCADFNWEPLSNEEVKEIQDKYSDVISRYGKSFAGEYGWAAILFGNTSDTRKPTFYELEKFVGLNHQRFFYYMANANVHGGVTGIAFRLSAATNPDELVTGQTLYGLGDPGRNASFALCLLTCRLLLSREGAEAIVNASAIRNLMEETHEAFYFAEEKLDEMTFDNSDNT